MELNPEDHPEAMHRIVTSIVAPRPIGWISTFADDRDNLAPYSYFNLVASSPPVIMFSGATHNGRSKDSVQMALKSGEFIANLVTENLIDQMDLTATSVNDSSEFDYANIERSNAFSVSAPRVDKSLACLECSVCKSIKMYDHTLVFGQVEHIFIDEKIMTNQSIDSLKINSVGRLGGPYYTGVEPLSVQRQNFGNWEGPTPPGFKIDEITHSLVVEFDMFMNLKKALKKIQTGVPKRQASMEVGVDESLIDKAMNIQDLYLCGETRDERVEAALINANIPAKFKT